MYPKMVVYFMHSQRAGAKQLKPVSRQKKLFLKKIKKLLTNINKYVKLIWLLKKQQTRTLIIEQQPSLKIQNKFSERTLLNE